MNTNEYKLDIQHFPKKGYSTEELTLHHMKASFTSPYISCTQIKWIQDIEVLNKDVNYFLG